MSVFINDADAFEKLVKVEGGRYRKLKSKQAFGDCSFDAFLEKWKQEVEDNPALQKRGRELAIDINGNRAIYGFAGLNRYAVYYSGEIVFLEMLTQGKKATERAKKAGFRIV